MKNRDKNDGKMQGRKSIFFVITIIILLIVVSGIIATSLNKNRVDNPIAVAHADNNITRSGESIQFYSDRSKGNIDYIVWNFSDGYESNEKNPSHTFVSPGWYHVRLTIQSDSGRENSTTILIGVQHVDTHDFRTVGRYINMNPSSREGPAWSSIIGPNIGNPSVNVTIDLTRVFGQFRINIGVRYTIDDQIHDDILYFEDLEAYGGDYHYDYLVLSSMIPVELYDSNGLIDVSIQLYQGKWEKVDISIESTFPMSELSSNVL